MSDTSQGPGWWLASDGQWYSPEKWNPPESVPERPPLGAHPPLQAPPSAKKLRHRWWLWATLGLVVFVTVDGIELALPRQEVAENRTQGAPQTSNGYPLGTRVEITQNGEPFYSVTATRFANPAQPELNVPPQNAGDIFVAVEFTIQTTGSLKLTDDILADTRIYDSNGQSFFGSLSDTASGPHFHYGSIEVAPGASESGWAMFEVPGDVQVTKITFTPAAGFATKAAVSWSLAWPRLR